MVATHIIPLSPWQDAAFSVRRGLVRRGMLSTKVRTLPGQTAAHAWQTALFSSATVEGGCSCLRSKLTFDPKHAQLGSCLDSELASPWPQHPAGPKRLPRHVLYGVRHCLGSKHSHVQTPPLAMATVDSSGSGCTDAGWRVPSNTTSSLLPTWWIAPHTMIDGPQFPSLGWTQALISLSPCLRRTWTRRSLWYRENQDSSLKIQCLHCLRSHTLCLLPHSRRRRLCSKVSLGHLAGCRDQYPAARSRLRMVRTRTSAPQNGRSSAFADEEPRWSGSFWSFGAVDGLPMAWRFSSNLHASSDVVGQPLGCVAKFCLCILETPPASWLLLVKNCHLLTTWQFVAVFALANFVAWSPSKVQRNINSLYRNPTNYKNIKVVMARQTSLQVTTPELTFFLLLSLSGPQTILTVFGDSSWLRNGSIKSTIFRSAIEHTARNNIHRSNSRKRHLVIVTPQRWPLVYS